MVNESAPASKYNKLGPDADMADIKFAYNERYPHMFAVPGKCHYPGLHHVLDSYDSVVV